MLSSTFQVVIAQRVKHSTKIIEPVLVSFQECLLRRGGVRPVKCSSTGHAPHCEQLQRGQLAIQSRRRLELPQTVCLRHEHFSDRILRLLALRHQTKVAKTLPNHFKGCRFES